jgi:hypothetical protein
MAVRDEGAPDSGGAHRELEESESVFDTGGARWAGRAEQSSQDCDIRASGSECGFGRLYRVLRRAAVRKLVPLGESVRPRHGPFCPADDVRAATVTSDARVGPVPVAANDAEAVVHPLDAVDSTAFSAL